MNNHHHHHHGPPAELKRNPIRLIVEGQLLRIVTPVVVSGSMDYLELTVSFRGAQWQGATKWVTFDMGDLHYVLPLHDDEISEEDGLNLTQGTWTVSIYGYRMDGDGNVIDQRITTTAVILFVESRDGTPFPPLTPTEAEVLAQEIEYTRDLAEWLKCRADNGYFDGATFIPSVSEDGIISWTNDKEKENPEPRDISGPKGDTGPDTVYIGEEEPEEDFYKVWIQPTGVGAFAIESFELISGSHLPGTVDTYRMTKTDGTTLDIQIYNGSDGSGNGDMVASLYDPQDKRTDIFEYVDDAVADNGKGIFWAEYGETTFAEVQQALNDGKAVLMKEDSRKDIYQLQSTDGNVFKFATYMWSESGYGTELYMREAVLSTTGWWSIRSVSAPDHYSFNEVAFTGSYNDLDDTPELADVATSGAYSDLTGKPTLDTAITAGSSNAPTSAAVKQYVDAHSGGSSVTVDTAMSSTSTNPVQNRAIKQYVDSHSFSGNYNDLTNKPTLENSIIDSSNAPTSAAVKNYVANRNCFVEEKSFSHTLTASEISAKYFAINIDAVHSFYGTSAKPIGIIGYELGNGTQRVCGFSHLYITPTFQDSALNSRLMAGFELRDNIAQTGEGVTISGYFSILYILR